MYHGFCVYTHVTHAHTHTHIYIYIYKGVKGDNTLNTLVGSPVRLIPAYIRTREELQELLNVRDKDTTHMRMVVLTI
jgi:hypothetical protein